MLKAIKPNLKLLLILAVVITSISCSKSDQPISYSTYKWNWKGINYEASFTVAHSSGGPSIVASSGDAASTNKIIIGIYLSSLDVGNYNFGALTNDSFSLVDANGITFKGDVVTLNIRSNVNNFISGSFTGILKPIPDYAFSFPITGYFENIRIEN